MDVRMKMALDRVFSELQSLRKGQGVRGIDIFDYPALSLMFGVDQLDFDKGIVSSIEDFVIGEDQKNCVIIAFNADLHDSDDDLTRRRETVVDMLKVSLRTVIRKEDQGLRQLAIGLIHKHGDRVDEICSGVSSVSREQAKQAVSERIAAIESQLSELKLMLDLL